MRREPLLLLRCDRVLRVRRHRRSVPRSAAAPESWHKVWKEERFQGNCSECDEREEKQEAGPCVATTATVVCSQNCHFLEELKFYD